MPCETVYYLPTKPDAQDRLRSYFNRFFMKFASVKTKLQKQDFSSLVADFASHVERLSMDDRTPCASTEEDLPGFVRWKKKNTSVSSIILLRTRHALTIMVMILLFAQFSSVEGCLPSWFRDDRKEAQALERNGSGDNEITEAPQIVEASHSSVKHNSHNRHPYETNEISDDDAEESDISESEELDALYGTAAPVRINHKLEEARKRHSKLRCKGWCYRGGNCSVDIDEVTYEVRSVNCHCPHGYWGSRCELHFVARLFAPVKGHVEVEKSGVSAFAFIILMVIVSIGLIFYTYRKIARRNAGFYTTSSLSTTHSLRRPNVSFQAMPTSINTTPCSSTAYIDRTTSQNYSCRLPFSPLSRSYTQLANQRRSACDTSRSLNLALSRLSLSSTKLMQNLEVPTLKSVTRTSSYPMNKSSSLSRTTTHDENVPVAKCSSPPSRISDDGRCSQSP
ncbi:unnamed protein product [Cylicocyclus nassatus]|uniref:EGF-like domain-containing protein n=1 Tax=Cylicocyclus nassatus TaxID=53992 RepID=A0AA36H5H1_CYLNA|nr:unnamed protein product [Cylicocyclus nassatus]